MAITIKKAPYLVTPSNNPSLWQVETSVNNLVYFNCELIEAGTTKVVLLQKYFSRPETPRLSSFNLSDILKNLVESKVDNNVSVIASPVVNSTFAYRLKITEVLISSAGVISNGAVYNVTADKFTIWDASLDRVLFNAFNQWTYNVTVNQKIKFLSTKQQVSNQSATSAELLYFLNTNSIAKKARIRFYNPDGTQVKIVEVPLPVAGMVRLNISPKTLNKTSAVDFTNIGSYRVDLIDASVPFKVLSEEKLYILKKNHCSLKPINLIYKNSLGGFDSVEFFNPIETVGVERSTLKQHVLQLNSNNEYSDNSNAVLNSDVKIINVNSRSTFKVFSGILSDFESIALKELFTSTDVYVELQDNTLVPIQIKSDSYNITQRYTNGNKQNRVELEFTSLFIPSNYSLGNGTTLTSAMIQFNDLPMPIAMAGGIIEHDSTSGTLTI